MTQIELEMWRQMGLKQRKYTHFFCKASVLDTNRRHVTSVESSCSVLNESDKIWRLVLIDIRDLEEFDESTDDVLLLDFEFIFASATAAGRIDGYHCAPLLTFELSTPPIENFQESNLCAMLKDIFVSSKYCDISLKVEGKVLEAHRAILVHNSPVFDAMFRSDMKEKQSSCIEVIDVDYNTMQMLLLYMYTGDVGDLTLQGASHLMYACDKYEFLALFEVCAAILKANLGISNVCEILCLADAYCHEDLKEDAIDFICENASKIFPYLEWREFISERNDLASVVLTRVSEYAIASS